MRTSIALTSSLTLASLMAIGCGSGPLALTPGVSSPVTTPSGIQGGIHGGQQPVNGATIQLYKANITGYGLASSPLIMTTVKSDGGGFFSITGKYSCQPADELYLVATGGDPSGSGGTNNNSALAMMAGLGRCDSLSSSTFIFVNELTTVATAYALAPFMGSMTQVSTSGANLSGLTNAFAAIPEVVDTTHGTLPGPSLPSGAVLPVALLNTLADVVANCINSVDSGGNQSSACMNLFNAAKPSTTAPTNTIQAVLNLAKNPTLATSLSAGVNALAPFQPTLNGTAPNDWAVAIVYSGGGLSNPKSIAADKDGNIWLANSAGSVSKFGPSGNALSGTTGFTASGLVLPNAIAVDSAGNAWVGNSGGTVTKIPVSGAGGVTYTGGGTTSTTDIAIDAASNVWISGTGTSKISEFASDGTPISGNGFSVTGPTTAIAINPK